MKRIVLINCVRRHIMCVRVCDFLLLGQSFFHSVRVRKFFFVNCEKNGKCDRAPFHVKRPFNQFYAFSFDAIVKIVCISAKIKMVFNDFMISQQRTHEFVIVSYAHTRTQRMKRQYYTCMSSLNARSLWRNFQRLLFVVVLISFHTKYLNCLFVEIDF